MAPTLLLFVAGPRLFHRLTHRALIVLSPMLRISASLFFAAPSAATTWTVAADWNAVPSGTPTTVTDLAACEATAAGHAQFAFNEN